MKVWVYYTPDAVPEGTPDCAIAIDVLRATSMIAASLHAGACGVKIFSEIEDLEMAARGYRGPKILAGERGGFPLPGYDMGNSPLACDPEVLCGKRVFLTTTNGTQMLNRLMDSPVLVAAALVNAGRVVSFLKDSAFDAVWIGCSGWEGAYSLEDAFCAGLIASHFEPANDEAHAAIALYQKWQDNPLKVLQLASHGQRLLSRGLSEDILYCSHIDSLNVLPMQEARGLLVDKGPDDRP